MVTIFICCYGYVRTLNVYFSAMSYNDGYVLCKIILNKYGFRASYIF